MTSLQSGQPGRRSFDGFRPAAFAFLRELAAHQSRDWFEPRKGIYEQDVRGPMAALVADLAADLPRRGLPLQGDPRQSLFRIHRDVRFSRDKRPYKTHIGATLTRDGGKLSPGLLYIHIDPEGSFVAAGFYRPDPPVLQALRTAMAEDVAGIRAVCRALAAADLAIEPDAEALARLPRGFEAPDPDIADLLRRKSFILRRTLAPEELADAGLLGRVASFALAAQPLLAFGWAAMDN